MFDYASLIRILEIGINPKSQYKLFVCENRNVKKSFLKKHPVLRTDYIYTINEIWKNNCLIGKRYNEYVLIK